MVFVMSTHPGEVDMNVRYKLSSITIGKLTSTIESYYKGYRITPLSNGIDMYRYDGGGSRPLFFGDTIEVNGNKCYLIITGHDGEAIVIREFSDLWTY